MAVSSALVVGGLVIWAATSIGVGTGERQIWQGRAPAETEARDVPVIMDGIIPPQDVAVLRRIGVRGIFGPRWNTAQIVSCILFLRGVD